ncbi:MAG: MFS transporter [Roseitalea sp.]|jgi:predicted MFS family arabinose efflux permease|nr:MFS transporter [Roseitalea sp.]MBO6720364.1 MFS transporter [Roseitalea sp.]MBO6742724.1 MFS transporter [Roseitalea sp.]
MSGRDGSADEPAELSPSVRNILTLFTLPQAGLFFGTRIFASIAVWIERLTTAWLAWELTQSTGWLGTIAFLRLAPALLVGPLGGAMADRTSPLLIMRACKAAIIGCSALLLGLVLADRLTIHALAILALLIGLVQAFGNPANKSIVWHLVPKAYLPVAIPVGSITFNLAGFIGPAIAGLLIATQGIAAAYGAALMLQLAFFAVLLTIGLSSAETDRARRRAAETTIAGDFIDGFRYALTDRTIAAILSIHLVFSLSARPLIDLMPALAAIVHDGGADMVGLMTAAMGGGAVIGGIWLAARSRVAGLARLLIGFMAVLMGFLIALPWVTSLAVGLVLLAAIGVCMIVRAAGTQMLLQFAVEDAMRGRVMGFYSLILRAGSATGALVIGVAAERLGLQWAIAGAAILGAFVLALTAHRFLGAAQNVGNNDKKLNVSSNENNF